MPRLLDDANMMKGSVGNFGYSAVRPDKLGAAEYTLVLIGGDISSSISGFESEINECIKAAVKACKKSPRAENLLIRRISFGSAVREEHGFMLLSGIDPDAYQPIPAGGSTVLLDAIYSGVGASQQYGSDLVKNGYAVNAISFFVTDGQDVGSKMGIHEIKKLLGDITKAEQIESHLTILIGINSSGLKVYQQKLVKDMGFGQYIDAGDATKENLAKLANFMSRSISSQSSSIGKGASQPLTI